MIHKIKTLILAAALPLAVVVPLAVGSPAVQAAPKSSSSDCITDSSLGSGNTSVDAGLNSGTNAALTGDCTTPSDNSTGSDFATLAAKIINILSVIVGVVAVVMIIFGGFKYITSGGESGNVSGAKNTLVYAIVGLVIVALAQFIVHFVLNNVGNAAAVVIFR
jgi:hypothetical protein